MQKPLFGSLFFACFIPIYEKIQQFDRVLSNLYKILKTNMVPQSIPPKVMKVYELMFFEAY